jgi:16S rRNA processing protein RimM
MFLHDSPENNISAKKIHGKLNSYLPIGTIKDAHGVNGQIKIKLYFEDPTLFFLVNEVFLGENYCSSKVGFKKKVDKKFWIVTFSLLTKREEIKKYRGQDVYCNRDILPSLDYDHYYYNQLIGLKVKIKNDTREGFIKNVVDYGSGDLLEIKIEKLKSTFFVPFNKENVNKINLSEPILLNPQKGLIPNS